MSPWARGTAMPVNGTIWPRVFEDQYEQFLSLQEQIEQEEDNVIFRAKAICQAAQTQLQALRHLVTVNSFASQLEEITFFKEIKPLFLAPFLYQQQVYTIELNRPAGTIEIQDQYLRNQILNIKHFFDKNTTFYHYYRSGETASDHLYFTRGHLPEFALQYPFTTQVDPTFSTGFDYLLARTKANDLTVKYLNQALYSLQHPEEIKESLIDFKDLQWTSSAIDLGEFIYGAIADGFINNGKTPASKLAQQLGRIFNVNLSFIHKKLEEIRNRKKNRTLFWDRVKRSLMRKMEEDDEHAL